MESDISFLCIADTHGAFSYYFPKSYIDGLLSQYKPNAVLVLGDCNLCDVKDIKSFFKDYPIYAICGNHDEPNLYTDNGISEIHGSVVEVNGVKILGWHGCVKYKEYQPYCFTQDESRSLALSMPSCDILISHDLPLRTVSDDRHIHAGLVGIYDYLTDRKCYLHLHGHIHDSELRTRINGVESISVYPMGYLQLNGESYSYQQIKPYSW